LMPLLAFSSGKRTVDVEIVRDVMAILDYELHLRAVSDPIDADNTIAKMEKSIRRQLQNRGPLSERDLRKFTNASRVGQWVFQTALKNLQTANDIRCPADKKWMLNEETGD